MAIRTLAVLVALAGWCEGQVTACIYGRNNEKYEVTGLKYGIASLHNDTSVLDNEAQFFEGCDKALDNRFIPYNYVITPLKSRRSRQLSWSEYIVTKGIVSKKPNQGAGDWISTYVSNSNAGAKPSVPVETNRFGDDQSSPDSWTSYIGGNWQDKDTVQIDQNTCGKVTIANPYPLVVNAKPTLIGQWPWQIALFHNKHFTCGGTLVSRRHVVTAAHCVTLEQSQDLVNKDALSVSLGVHNLRKSTQGVQNKNVKKIIVHPQYSGSTYANDLSVMKLAGSVEVTDYVRPICLWPEHETDLSHVIGKTGIVVGWGQNENRVTTDELGLVRMPIASQQDCLKVNRRYDESRWSTTFCAGLRDDTTACYGDSGGGMVMRKQDTWYLRGLVSLTINDCDPSHYIIFTDLAKFLRWIKENIQ